MTDPDPFTLQSAFDASRRGELAIWVGDFLASRGSDNATLAASLAQQEHAWLGPTRVSLDELVQLAGPKDEDVLCPVEPREWERGVRAMEQSIEHEWQPPPLLVEHRDGQLLLQDGNHRYDALVRAGHDDAWVIIWFDDPNDKARYEAASPARSGAPVDDRVEVGLE
jgi:hypothetical protein